MRRLGRILLVLSLLSLVLVVIFRSWVGAQYDAVVVLGTTLDTPVLGTVAETFTREPTFSEDTIGEVPYTQVTPPGDGPWPAVVFVTGASAEGRVHPTVRRLGRGLARAGFLVVIPELPGLRTGTISTDPVDAAVDVINEFAGRDDVKGGQVSVASVSVGAALTLLAAAREETQGKVRAVAAIAPFADLKNILLLATTGSYRDAEGRLGTYTSDPFLKQTVRGSLAEALRSDPQLAPVLEQLEAMGIDVRDPVEALVQAPLGILPDEAAAVVEVLANRDPKRFDELYERLPGEVKAAVVELSPIEHAADLDMPVELATPPRDEYFPLSESQRLEDELPDARLTVTSSLRHVIPEAGAGGNEDLWALNTFSVRFLREAADTD